VSTVTAAVLVASVFIPALSELHCMVQLLFNAIAKKRTVHYEDVQIVGQLKKPMNFNGLRAMAASFRALV
jgi:hypothetical protein